MRLAKQSVAKSFLLGPILDADGVAKTNEVVGSIKVTKEGSVGAPHGSSTLTHNHTGHYIYAANSGDFDTLGVVTFSLNSGVNAMQPVSFLVVTADVYNSLCSTTVLGQAGAAAALIAHNSSTHSAADVVAAIGTGSTLTACLTATGFSTHSAADVWSVESRTITGGTIGTYSGNTPQTGDAYAVVAHADYGNAQLVRSTTPANTLTVDANHLVAVPDTQKVDVNTIKTKAVACDAGVTVSAYVGNATAAIAVSADGYVKAVPLTVRDAMKLAPSAGEPEAGSVDALLAAILPGNPVNLTVQDKVLVIS